LEGRHTHWRRAGISLEMARKIAWRRGDVSPYQPFRRRYEATSSRVIYQPVIPCMQHDDWLVMYNFVNIV
jgi:hypothetical protein